jgi:hypothetical protein
MKLWHGVIVGVAILTIAALLSMTLGLRLFSRHGLHASSSFSTRLSLN